MVCDQCSEAIRSILEDYGVSFSPRHKLTLFVGKSDMAAS